jgi:hypothetical protein|tara:strand:+ start:7430 stop:7600 length:171 start_codon:yes stop_codon:yes gene_type:complete
MFDFYIGYLDAPGLSLLVEKIASLLVGVGLTGIRIEKLPLEPVCAVCVLASAPAES